MSVYLNFECEVYIAYFTKNILQYIFLMNLNMHSCITKEEIAGQTIINDDDNKSDNIDFWFHKGHKAGLMGESLLFV